MVIEVVETHGNIYIYFKMDLHKSRFDFWMYSKHDFADPHAGEI